MTGLPVSGGARAGGVIAPRLGLGLSLPGVAALGGNLAGKVYSTAVFRLDARLNPDQSTGAPTDLSANALSVTSFGGVTWTAGSHWTFDGVNDMFEVANNAVLNFGASESFTILAVVTPANVAAEQAIVAKKAGASAAAAGWSLTQHSGGTFRGRIADGTVQGSPDGPASNVNNTTYLASLVRNVSADTFQVGRNNTFGTGITDLTTATLTNTEVMRIGRFSGGSTSWFAGNVRYVSVHRSALPTSEIAAVAADFAL